MKPAMVEDEIVGLSPTLMKQVEAPPLRVLQLLDTAQFAGTERLVLSLTAALARAGTVVSLGCRRDSPIYKAAVEQGLDVVPLFTSGMLPTRSSLEPRLPQVLPVIKQVRQQSINIVHGHNGRTTLAAAVTARVTQATAIASQHFVSPASAGYRGPKRILANAAHGWVNRHLSAVVAVSDAARTEMIRRTGFPSDRIIHIPNGIDPPAAPSPSKIAALRAELKISAGTPLVVTVARLAEEKGLELWVDAVAQVHAARPDVRFVIVGEGPRREAIVARMADRGITEILTLVGFRTDATDWIAAGDLFVLPSPAEPFGLVLLEAMSLGKPVVACGAAGPLDIITSDVDGMLVPPENAPAMAEAVTGLLGDTRRADRIGTAGQESFNQRFTADRMAAELLNVYRSALERAH